MPHPCPGGPSRAGSVEADVATTLMILTSGAFDGLHAGHVAYLRAAARLSDDGQRDELLLVAVAPDAYIRQAKGREPFWTQRDRAATVEALHCVSGVLYQQDLSPADLIRTLRPRLFVKGADWHVMGLPIEVTVACAECGTVIVFTETSGRHVREARRDG